MGLDAPRVFLQDGLEFGDGLVGASLPEIHLRQEQFWLLPFGIQFHRLRQLGLRLLRVPFPGMGHGHQIVGHGDFGVVLCVGLKQVQRLVEFIPAQKDPSFQEQPFLALRVDLQNGFRLFQSVVVSFFTQIEIGQSRQRLDILRIDVHGLFEGGLGLVLLTPGQIKVPQMDLQGGVFRRQFNALEKLLFRFLRLFDRGIVIPQRHEGVGVLRRYPGRLDIFLLRQILLARPQVEFGQGKARLQGFFIDLDGRLEHLLRLGQILFHDVEVGQMEIGLQFHLPFGRLFALRNGLIQVLFGQGDIAQQQMGGRVPGVLCQNRFRLLSGLFLIPGQEIQLPQLVPRLDHPRIDFNGFGHFGIGFPEHPHPQVGQPQFIMGLDVLGIQLEHIFVFQYRLPRLVFGKVLLAFFPVPFHLRFLGTPGQSQKKGQEDHGTGKGRQSLFFRSHRSISFLWNEPLQTIKSLIKSLPY